MAAIKHFSLILLSFLILGACNSQPKKVVEVKTPVVYRAPYDTLTDNIGAFISGIKHIKGGCFAGHDTASVWKKFAFSMDSGFAELDTTRFNKMRAWADSELQQRKSDMTLFYPFGGPDFLNANIFYPNAESYILIGLEPVGKLPDLCSMNTEQVNKYLGDIWYSLKDIYKRSYFITGNMIGALKKTSVNGSVPLMVLFIKRSGYHIVSLKYVGVDTTGSCQPSDSLKNKKGVTDGVQIVFAADTGRKIQTAYYFQTDISDEGLKKNHGFSKYLSKLPMAHTYLKAASYLMHGKDFSKIRNTVFEKSSSILQDDSGIAYAYFDKKIWDIHLYGKYIRPGKEFSWINETDLAKAYNDPSIKPVPFTLGYNWRTRAINMLYAIKK